MHLVLMLIVVAIGLYIFFKLPLWLQVILLGLNTVIPDPIPFVDEILMAAGVIKNLLAKFGVSTGSGQNSGSGVRFSEHNPFKNNPFNRK